MKEFKDFINEMGDEHRVNVPITAKYITGLKNRLWLLRPEEIAQLQRPLMELRQVIDQSLSGNG